MSIESLPSPVVFDELTLSEAKKVLKKALKLANYDEETKTMYRPLRMEELPSGLKGYRKELERVYPKGEKRSLERMSYERVYNWLQDSCPSCGGRKESVGWEMGDKHLTYFCRNCGEETAFVRHHHYEAESVYNRWIGVKREEDLD